MEVRARGHRPGARARCQTLKSGVVLSFGGLGNAGIGSWKDPPREGESSRHTKRMKTLRPRRRHDRHGTHSSKEAVTVQGGPPGTESADLGQPGG